MSPCNFLMAFECASTADQSSMAYPPDLTDEQWRLVRHLFDPPRRAGRPHRWSRRRMVNAILWQTKMGSQWRMLPGSFPRWGSVWQQFRRWRDAGVWAEAMAVLRREVRRRAGRDPEPSMVILDAQQARTGRQGPSFHDVGGVGRGRGLAGPSAACWWTHSACRSQCVSRARDRTTRRRAVSCSTQHYRTCSVCSWWSPTGATGDSRTMWHPVTAGVSRCATGTPSPTGSSPPPRCGASRTALPSWDGGLHVLHGSPCSW